MMLLLCTCPFHRYCVKLTTPNNLALLDMLSGQSRYRLRIGVAPPPPPLLSKHVKSQRNNGHTGSWCLDKAVLLRDVQYQKNVCRRKPAHTSPSAQLS